MKGIKKIVKNKKVKYYEAKYNLFQNVFFTIIMLNGFAVATYVLVVTQQIYKALGVMLIYSLVELRFYQQGFTLVRAKNHFKNSR